MDLKQKKQFYSLLNALREEVISDEQLGDLEHMISSDTEAAREYVLFVKLWTDFQFFGAANAKLSETSADLGRYADFWEAMADYEKQAPELELPKEKPQRELIQKVVYPVPEKRKISRFGIVTLLNAAAVLLFFLVLRVVPPSGGLEAAVLSDSLNAQWANRKGVFQKGDRLRTGNKMFLDRGLVEIEFDGGARAVLEAPAEFKILAEDRLGLTYGKVYATVPEKAIGFSVYTPIAKIIDMGTEFGVEADWGGDTQLHVLEGRTALLVGRDDHTVNLEVGMGQARKISGRTQVVTEIPLHEHHFARAFDSTGNTVWRRQMSLDLADMVRNGDGLGTGNAHVRLDYLKGFTTDQRGGETLIAEDYLPIEDHPFIDGIFIPNGRAVVSSRGDIFDDFVITSGVHCADLLANPPPDVFVVDDRQHIIRFNGQEYSDRGKSCIVMRHSNHGITFDLKAIRDHYNLRVDRFTSRVGLIEIDNKRCNANFYVLVDGQLRYSLLGYSQKGVLNEVSVKLEDSDRFLTLATSENVDQIDYMANSTLYENWCIFAEPVLVLDRVDNLQY